jgi:hypothetical protein
MAAQRLHKFRFVTVASQNIHQIATKMSKLWQAKRAELVRFSTGSVAAFGSSLPET